jgi:hypothetical protein
MVDGFGRIADRSFAFIEILIGFALRRQNISTHPLAIALFSLSGSPVVSDIRATTTPRMEPKASASST